MDKRTVLFVDDELNILSSLRRGLMDVEYKCIFANSGTEALEIMEKEEISVIVADMKMPVMDGLKLLRIVKEKHPNTVRMVLSGYMQIPQLLATINQADIYRFITKPWKVEEELKFNINQALEYYNLQKESRDLKAALEKRNQLYQNIMKTTDEKLSNYKRELENAKLLFATILEMLIDYDKKERSSENSKEAYENKKKQVEGIYYEYLNSIANGYVDFSNVKLSNEIDAMFRKWNIFDRYDIKSDMNSSVISNKNFRAIMLVVEYLSKSIFEYFKDCYLSINIINIIEESSKIYSFFYIEQKEEITQDTLNEYKKLEIITILQQIALFLNGSIEFKKNNDKLLVLFKIDIKAD